MANELRIRQNFLGGKIEDNPLLIGATTLTSAALAAMVAVTATQHLAITLDPDGLYGEPEIVYITAHSAAAATATILRAQEGSTARQHARDVDWSHGPTVYDVLGDSAWIAPAFTNAWANVGGAYMSAGYRRDAGGWVHLRGVIGTGASGSSAFTLPAGYRPAGTSTHILGGGAGNYADIAAAGTVTITRGVANAALDGTIFLAEA